MTVIIETAFPFLTMLGIGLLIIIIVMIGIPRLVAAFATVFGVFRW